MAELPKKKPVTAPEKRKKFAMRDPKGSPILSAEKGKQKGPLKEGRSFKGEGAKGRAVKSLDAYNKGGYVKGKGMSCGGMTKKGKK